MLVKDDYRLPFSITYDLPHVYSRLFSLPLPSPCNLCNCDYPSGTALLPVQHYVVPNNSIIKVFVSEIKGSKSAPAAMNAPVNLHPPAKSLTSTPYLISAFK